MSESRPRTWPFAATIFLGALLLFLVQPMMGRYILPWFGGGPAVWTLCLLFFQIFLLVGYAYAHWLGSRPSLRLQASVHVVLLAASLWFLPVNPRGEVWRAGASADPSGRILWLLTVTIGAPYLLLAATGPLLQRWFTIEAPGKLPWRLYALSNVGSFLALLSYPILLEPYLRLSTQASVWSAMYVVFAAACGWTAWRLRGIVPASRGKEEDAAGDARPRLWTMLFWLALSACGSILLVATTNQISQEIAVNPFLWVAALSIYLLTFILAFESDRLYRRGVLAVAAGVLAPVACALWGASGVASLGSQLGIYLLALFATCMVCQGELAKSRPSPRYLTGFYLTIAAGGAIGGAFVALVAPHLFTEFSEYPIGLAAACLLGFVGWLRTGAFREWTSRNFSVRVPLMALLIGGLGAIVATFTGNNQPSLASARNFYGILRVLDRVDHNGRMRELRHGRTRHGSQYMQEPQRGWATSYYGPHGGVALALNAMDQPQRRIAVVGLGAGTLAAWGRPGDEFRFYEINPDVEKMARDWFFFLKDSRARTEVVLGDARIEMARELAAGQAHDFDMIAVDAFSGDAIPMHLLTAECADIYRQRLKPGGLLLLHISNRAVNLDPVARGMTQYLGWKAVQFLSGDDEETGEASSRWVLLTSNVDWLERTGFGHQLSGWSPRPPIVWTDDFASLWPVVKF